MLCRKEPEGGLAHAMSTGSVPFKILCRCEEGVNAFRKLRVLKTNLKDPYTGSGATCDGSAAHGSLPCFLLRRRCVGATSEVEVRD